MHAARSILALVLLAALSTGCGDDDPTEPEGLAIADLVGSWSATSVSFTSQADASQTVDFIGIGGETRFTMLEDGRTRTWVDLGDFSDEWDAQASINGDVVTMSPAEASRPTRRYTVVLNGNQLSMTSTDATFDFTLTGAAGTPANSEAVFVRTN